MHRPEPAKLKTVQPFVCPFSCFLEQSPLVLILLMTHRKCILCFSPGQPLMHFSQQHTQRLALKNIINEIAIT